MQKSLALRLIGTLLLCCSPALVAAQLWQESIRGSWLAEQSTSGALVIVNQDVVADIVISTNAPSNVRQAARFLAADINKITGQTPNILHTPRSGAPHIRFVTISADSVETPFATEHLEGLWEAFRIETTANAIWLVGSNPRGTAFAGYAFSERIGIDPLHHWTGYQPARQNVLAVKRARFESKEPTFKYRGLFHDDEDILPRPFDQNGYPQYAGGEIPKEWYERYFETALRLRMNQVAPFVRVVRPFEIRQLASDWGLIYTSHHYDILLSNPFGYERFNLATKRGVEGDYNWSTNQQGIRQYWRAGVEEHKTLDTIWPVGLRGTADTAYEFAAGTTQAQKNEVFVKAIQDQVDMTKKRVGKNAEPVFHFTLYGEMLTNYQSGNFDFPEDVILVWNDTGDGLMRALPKQLGNWKHGIYYHLAYYGATTKQTHHTIRPDRIEAQFRAIVESGATEYLLLNVSELREFVMNTRFIADIAWNAPEAFSKSDAAGRFVNWWSREYFGEQAAELASSTYAGYFDILNRHDAILYGARSLDTALNKITFRLNGDHHVHYTQEDLDNLSVLNDRLAKYAEVLEHSRGAQILMNEAQQQFFFENAELGLLMDYYPTKAAAQLNAAFRMYPDEDALAEIGRSLETLKRLEQAIERAQRSPFENWYRSTWIRRENSRTNPHYAYNRVKQYLESYQPRYK